jgi:hypothetical protein
MGGPDEHMRNRAASADQLDQQQSTRSSMLVTICIAHSACAPKIFLRDWPGTGHLLCIQCSHASATACLEGSGLIAKVRPPGIGRVACFTGEAVPQAPGSWVRPAESCVISQYDCAPPVEPQKKVRQTSRFPAKHLRGGTPQDTLYQWCRPRDMHLVDFGHGPLTGWSALGNRCSTDS